MFNNMSHPHNLFSPAHRLLRALTRSQPSRETLRCPRIATPCRTYMSQSRIAATNAAPRQIDKLAEFVRDEQIDTTSVQVKVAEGVIEEPQPLRQILQSIDRDSHCVVQLSKPGERDVAVVQIRSKLDLLKQLRDRESQQRQIEFAKREKKPKQIELNWAISENDLNLKLKQMEGFLEKGKTVEILLAAKKRQRKATEEEGSSVLNRIRQAVQDTGAKEVKPMQGQVLKQATLILKK